MRCANIASEQTITKGTNITQSVGSASNLQGGNVNINAQDITNTASNITAGC
jgi:hypothetical protein